MSEELVRLSKEGAVGVITVDNPPVNALSPGVPEGILNGVQTFNADDSVNAIVLIGAGGKFIAGADIRFFGKERAKLPMRPQVALEQSRERGVAEPAGRKEGALPKSMKLKRRPPSTPLTSAVVCRPCVHAVAV